MSRAYKVCTIIIFYTMSYDFFCDNGLNTKFVEKQIQKFIKQYIAFHAGIDAPDT